MLAISAPSYGYARIPAVLALGAERASAAFEGLEQAPVDGHPLDADRMWLLLLLLLAGLVLDAVGPLGSLDHLAERAAPGIVRMLLATEARPVLIGGHRRCRQLLPAQ